MNVRKRLEFVLVAVFALAAISAGAEPVRKMIAQGNKDYAGGQYTEAINKYNEALVEKPGAVEPKFNKANSYYRLDDLAEATDLFQEVAAESKDMSLVAKAKYNLGDCLFQQGTKQRDSDLRKAVEDMKKSISYWRGVLDIEPDNQKAARNIEVARLTIKDILDQLKKQEQEQKKQQQKNQSNQQQQQKDQQKNQGQGQQQNAQQKQQNQSGSQHDPNQPQDPNQVQGAKQKQNAKQPENKQQDQQGDQQKAKQKVMAPDATAQQILDKEQRQKDQRRIQQTVQGGKVDKDW